MFRRILLFCLLWFTFSQAAVAQELVTSTPVRIDIPTQAAPTVDVLVTPTVTRTPTPSTVVLEARADAGEVNVRAEADIEAELLGTIRAGEFYPVLGRYFRWIQFQFDSSPTGRGWVFDELVTITGDESTIPDLSEEPLPTTDPSIAAATQTQEAITQIPGGVLTVTAESRTLELPGLSETALPGVDIPGGERSDLNIEAQEEGNVDALPTFTYPPNLVAAVPTEAIITDVTVTPTTSTEDDAPPLAIPDNVPPLLPILLLGAGGLLGLVVSSLRR